MKDGLTSRKEGEVKKSLLKDQTEPFETSLEWLKLLVDETNKRT